MFADLRKAFPDLQWTVKEIIAEGDKVVARLNVSGTHKKKKYSCNRLAGLNPAYKYF